MRHRKSGRKLNRKRSHFKSMFKNMVCSLLEHGIIKTTLAKAKELRGFVEPLITLSKKDNLSNRRLALKFIRNTKIISKLFLEIGPKFALVPGGYTRISKYGFRKGDNAILALIELIKS